MKKAIVLFCILVFSFTSIFAHSGGTDAYGGHHDKKRGGYHYHNAGRAHAASNPYQDHDKCGICGELTSKESLLELETLLTKSGYFGGKVDGKIDAETIKAIKHAQLDYGISTTGVATEYLLSLLRASTS